MNGFYLTNYHVDQIKYYSKYILLAIISIFIAGNIINALIKDRVSVNESAYETKDGFPLFSSQKEYISLLKKYPYNIGTKLYFHKMEAGESFWNVSQKYNIDIPTLIAANPFLTSLLSKEGIEIVIPSENGVLVACDNFYDANRMSKLLNNKEILGDYFPSIFDLFSIDDMKFVFFKNSYPIIVNNYMQELCNIKKNFQKPSIGRYTSLYGMRKDPFTKKMAFHDGIDIHGKIGAPIKALKEGIVSFAGWKKGFGYTLKIIHADGYVSTYAHCSKLHAKKGDFVSKNDIIASIGSTGRSTGPHLHLEISRHGNSLDPLYFIW